MSDAHDAWLADAALAAREVAHDDAPASIEGAATRARIHATLERRRGTQKKRFTLIAAVVASMFGSTAFAYYSGIGPFKKAAAPAPAPAIATSEPAPAAKPPGHAPIAPAVEVVPPAPEPTPEVVAPTPAPTPPIVEPAPTAEPAPIPKRTPRVTPEPAPEAAPAPEPEPVPAPLPAPDAELLAYQQAHDAHFKGGRPAVALAAWDRYLAQFPDGKLAPEARYDRALVLVKLERWSEARVALAPFANAPAGAYRQREAAKILDAIKDR
ncbi:MAG: hypothetical protein SFX73_27540 [Kofleriaceae bacterium]|nr:hypothetical protein [Kofleriaceae bacterium]